MLLGIDTSNYTTSVALYDSVTKQVVQRKKLLPVAEGARGIRQSDAVFHHTVQLPALLEELFSLSPVKPSAIGVSVTPTTVSGSYMPCFLVGESAARALSAAFGVGLHRFSHQQGHIAAALYSAGKTGYFHEPFLAFHVSGGTTDAVRVEPDEKEILKITPLCASMDLKAGQAIDRIGVKMGLSFPCGRELDALSLSSEREYHNKIKLYDGNCSLSGLENQCLKRLEDGESPPDVAKYLLCYLADTLTAMASKLLEKEKNLPLVFSGGVCANTLLRERLGAAFGAAFAAPEFSADNASGAAILASCAEGKL